MKLAKWAIIMTSASAGHVEGEIFTQGTCYEDSHDRILPHSIPGMSKTNSRENCLFACIGDGYQFAGVESEDQCFCGNDPPPPSKLKPDEECDQKCSGNKQETCGGDWRINVYEAKDVAVLEPRVHTNLGRWWGWRSCPPKSHARGFTLYYEPDQGGGDDTSLSGLQLRCFDLQDHSETVGHIQAWGDNEGPSHSAVCPRGTFINAMRVKSEPHIDGDNTATNNVQMRCSDEHTVLTTEAMEFGDWSEWKRCPTGQYISAINVQIQDWQRDGDDTSVNKIRFGCISALKVSQIIYEAESRQIIAEEPEIIKQIDFSNPCEMDEKCEPTGVTMAIAKETTATKSWSRTAGESISVGVEFTSGDPVFFSSTVTMDFEAHQERSWGSQVSEVEKWSAEFPCQAPAGMKIHCEFSVTRVAFTVPFTLIWENGEKTSGVFTGVEHLKGFGSATRECINEAWCTKDEDRMINISDYLTSEPVRNTTTEVLIGNEDDLIPEGVNCPGNAFFEEKAFDARIVGGFEAVPNSWNWMASIQKDNFHYCGGSIVNDQWILTAAHCVTADILQSTVAVNIHNLSEDGQRYQILEARIHPDYDAAKHDNDIALLRVETLTLGGNANVICLPSQNAPKIDADGISMNGADDFGENCFVAGWGRLSHDGVIAENLQSAKIKIFSDEICASDYGELFHGKWELCAGKDHGGKDSCQGDSGGPLVCIKNNEPVLVGVSSWGIGCGETGHPGVYTQANLFINWMEYVIEGQYAELRNVGEKFQTLLDDSIEDGSFKNNIQKVMNNLTKRIKRDAKKFRCQSSKDVGESRKGRSSSIGICDQLTEQIEAIENWLDDHATDCEKQKMEKKSVIYKKKTGHLKTVVGKRCSKKLKALIIDS